SKAGRNTMLRRWIQRLFGVRLPEQPAKVKSLWDRNVYRPRVESLHSRNLLTTSATFSGGILSVFGDSANNAIIIDATDATPTGTISITDGGSPVTISGGPATNGTTTQIRVFAGDGDDSTLLTVNVDMTSPSALVSLVGGSGNDTLIGSIDRANINGQDGNDLLV